jgi:hypothetical protein
MSAQTRTIILTGVLCILVASLGTYLFYSERHAPELAFLKKCGAANEITYIQLDNFSDSTGLKMTYDNPDEINKIIKGICEAPVTNIVSREGLLRTIDMHLHFKDNKVLTIQLMKDDRNVVMILYNPDGTSLLTKESSELTFLFR